MSKLALPNVTLVMVETLENTLAMLAVEECLRVAEFSEVLILTNDFGPYLFSAPFPQHNTNALRFHEIPNAPDKLGWCRQSWYDVPPLLQTTHCLQIQWDSWIWDPTMWQDEFLQYDYIGAPWGWFKDGKDVGNSGFSLVSTRLKRYLASHRLEFPCDSTTEDGLICRKYRAQLELAGFVWAPESVAYKFSYEGCAGNPPTKHFGFHGAFNFAHVLPHDKVLERAELMINSPYISKSYIMQAFCQKNPEIIKELVAAGGHDIDTLTSKGATAHG